MVIKKYKYEKYLYKWLLNKRKFVKESTYANYSNIVFKYIIPYIGNYYINSINHDILQNYIFILSDNNLSNKTIKDIMLIVKSTIKQLFYDNKIKIFNLKFYYPKDNKNKKMYVLSKNEQNKLMEYILNNINNKNIGILLSLMLGLRIGEVCALKYSDIDFKRNIIHINKTLQRIYIKENKKSYTKIIITEPKSINSIRDIPVNENIIKILKKFNKSKDYYILTNNNKYIEPRVYRSYFNNLLKKLNINHFSFHSLRHTFATNCISLNIDYKTVSELLGHSNINITLNLYVHPNISQKRKCINMIYKNITK